MFSTAGQALDTLDMLKLASGGTAASEASEVAVNPTGSPSGVRAVTTATPAAWRLKACLKASRPCSAFGRFVSLVSIVLTVHDKAPAPANIPV